MWKFSGISFEKLDLEFYFYLMYPKVHHNSEGIRLAVEAFRVVAERQAETVMV